jgi:hypothetical protein
MSSAGRDVSSKGCVTKPKERGIGLRSCLVQIQSSLLTGSYVMAMAEQREPYESRGSRTVLGEPRGESPPGHSTKTAANFPGRHGRTSFNSGLGQGPEPPASWRFFSRPDHM